jgi:uncharacterized protein YbaP (TraB family)
VLAAVGAALACAKPPPPVPPPPAAFYWEIEGPDGAEYYLLGSVHIGDGRELQLHPRVEADWGRAEELVVEVDTRALSPFDALAVAQRFGLLTPDRSLRDVVSEETHALLVAYLRGHRYPLDAASRMRPWLLAQIVAQIEFEAAGYDAENGVDAWFLRLASNSKPVVQLESLEEQLAIFGGLPPALEEALLREMLSQTDAFVETTHAILRAWEAGDEARLLELLLGPSDDASLGPFHQKMFVERNYRMAERLVALARDGGKRFVVVGTGHLIGPESVPELLEARGFEVQRVPDAFVRAVPLEPPIPETLPKPEATQPLCPGPRCRHAARPGEPGGSASASPAAGR